MRDEQTCSCHRCRADVTCSNIILSRKKRREGARRSRSAHLPLMAIRLTFDCACGAFGMVTVSTPFLNEAETLS
jgi:hypothetical protein